MRDERLGIRVERGEERREEWLEMVARFPLSVSHCLLSVVCWLRTSSVPDTKIQPAPPPFVTFCHLAFEKGRNFALQALVFQCIRRLKKIFKSWQHWPSIRHFLGQQRERLQVSKNRRAAGSPPKTNADFFFGGDAPPLKRFIVEPFYIAALCVCKQRKNVCFVYALFSHIGEVIFIICKTSICKGCKGWKQSITTQNDDYQLFRQYPLRIYSCLFLPTI